jgi:hypothetical protein
VVGSSREISSGRNTLSSVQRVVRSTRRRSGHFSLPAFRVDEVAGIAAETEYAASNLLWLSAAYLEEAAPTSRAESLVARVPGLLRGKEAAP